MMVDPNNAAIPTNNRKKSHFAVIIHTEKYYNYCGFIILKDLHTSFKLSLRMMFTGVLIFHSRRKKKADEYDSADLIPSKHKASTDTQQHRRLVRTLLKLAHFA